MSKVSNILAHYFTLQSIMALEHAHVFDLLAAHREGLSVHAIAEQLMLDVRVLEALCTYVSLQTPEFLMRQGDGYIVGPAFCNRSFQNTIFFALAYKPTTDVLAALLEKKKVYGANVIRNGTYLCLSSAIHNENAESAVVDLVGEYGAGAVIDIGCGSGSLLHKVADWYPSLRCFGVETDAHVVAEARERSKGREQIKIEQGDAVTPHEWVEAFKAHVGKAERVLIIGVTVWHEFLIDGEQSFAKVIANYRSLFTSPTFVIVESNGHSFEEFASLDETQRDFASVYQLVHPLTNQGSPQSSERWGEILAHTGLRVTKQSSVPPDMSIYVAEL